MRIDTLKIDRSFIGDMTPGLEGLALVSTIISLAYSLRLKVEAEGVETEEQSRPLRLLGSVETQGISQQAGAGRSLRGKTPQDRSRDMMH